MALPDILCITCNNAVQKGIYNSAFYPNLFTMLSAFIVIGLIISLLWLLGTKTYKTLLLTNEDQLNPLPLVSAGVVLGIGFGGFADGIVLHQILQWHEMLTAKIPADTLVNKSVNMFWDGIFHAFTLMTSLLGVYLLFKVLHQPSTVRAGGLLSGAMIGGWGIFNLVEGLINHQILKLHNVYEYTMNKEWYNYGFILSGVLMMLVGWLVSKKYFDKPI